MKLESNNFLYFINDNPVKCINNEKIKIDNENNSSSDSQDKNYKNKINELEKYIKELELKIKEKDLIINEERIKNEILNQKLQYISNNNPNIKNITELEEEIQLFKKYYNFSKGEKLLSIKFISQESDVDYFMIVKNTDNFSKIENMLYEKYPNYVETENYFLVNGNKINKHKTLEQNNIKNLDTLTLVINNID